MSNIRKEVKLINKHISSVHKQKRQRLKDVDFFVLDNSIRESTVGQLRSHTLENKIEIFAQSKKCGFKHIIVASFSHMTRVDDQFVEYLKEKGEDFDSFYSFSEVTEGLKKDKTYDTETIPVALKKNRKYGLKHTFFEIDLANDDCDWEKFTIQDMSDLVHQRMKYVREQFPDARILINLRDLPLAMTKVPERVLTFVKNLAKLPKAEQMFALAFEDPMGEYLPEELEAWTASLRRVMDKNGWRDGHLLSHIHQKWDLQTSSTLDCISAGSDGMWASLCEEGAAMGHASSAVTIMNLIRLGNKKVLEKYNCVNLRNAARVVTKITTGKDPHPKQCVYGDRAIDLVFDALGVGDFDLASFFGVEPPNRITTLASEDMLIDRLTNLFGPNPQFNNEIAGKMKERMLEDLREGRKEEYMSRVGIILLFDRSGGQLTEEMCDEIAKVKMQDAQHKQLIDEIRKEWDRWDTRDKVQGDDCLQFDNFYHGFMAPYFGCYRCANTKKGLAAIDMDNDGLVDWKEFMVYIQWALHQYPDVDSADDLLSIVFEKGLIPAMRDVRIKSKN